MNKQKNETTTRTCFDCMHCQACHLWNNGAISDKVAQKCPQYEPARYATLAELQDLYRMHKGELVPVVRCKDCKNRGTSYDCPFRRLVFTEAEGYHYEDVTLDDSFCSFGKRREDALCG